MAMPAPNMPLCISCTPQPLHRRRSLSSPFPFFSLNRRRPLQCVHGCVGLVLHNGPSSITVSSKWSWRSLNQCETIISELLMGFVPRVFMKPKVDNYDAVCRVSVSVSVLFLFFHTRLRWGSLSQCVIGSVFVLLHRWDLYCGSTKEAVLSVPWVFWYRCWWTCHQDLHRTKTTIKVVFIAWSIRSRIQTRKFFCFGIMFVFLFVLV